MPCYRASVQPSGELDHFPIILDWKGCQDRVPYPFRFNRSWLMLDVFEDFLKSSWHAFSASIADSKPIYTLILRLKSVKAAIIPWVKKMKFE